MARRAGSPDVASGFPVGVEDFWKQVSIAVLLTTGALRNWGPSPPARSLEERPLSSLLRTDRGEHASSRHKSVFVMDFPGDVQASQLNQLREEVTGVVRSARPGDETLVVLQSGGGTVTGYGLAAGQLARLKERGMKLTIAVEQVAASGGYMICCVADRIVASPVYRVRYDPPPEVPNQLQALFAAEDGVPVAGKDDSLGRRAIRWLVRSFAEEVRDVTGGVAGGVPLEERYMARDDTQDRIRASADDSGYY